MSNLQRSGHSRGCSICVGGLEHFDLTLTRVRLTSAAIGATYSDNINWNTTKPLRNVAAPEGNFNAPFNTLTGLNDDKNKAG